MSEVNLKQCRTCGGVYDYEGEDYDIGALMVCRCHEEELPEGWGLVNGKRFGHDEEKEELTRRLSALTEPMSCTHPGAFRVEGACRVCALEQERDQYKRSNDRWREEASNRINAARSWVEERKQALGFDGCYHAQFREPNAALDGADAQLAVMDALSQERVPCWPGDGTGIVAGMIGTQIARWQKAEQERDRLTRAYEVLEGALEAVARVSPRDVGTNGPLWRCQACGADSQSPDPLFTPAQSAEKIVHRLGCYWQEAVDALSRARTERQALAHPAPGGGEGGGE